MIVTLLSSRPGMFGWIAVHVHANKVTPQLQMISHRVLGSLVDEVLLVASVGILVSLRTIGSDDAWTNEIYDRTTQSRMVMTKLRVHLLFVLLSVKHGLAGKLSRCTSMATPNISITYGVYN